MSKLETSKTFGKIRESAETKKAELLENFKLQIEQWANSDIHNPPLIKEEEKEKLLQSLEDPEVKKLIQLFFEHQIIGWTALNWAVWMPIGVATAGPVAGPLIAEGARSALKFVFTKQRTSNQEGSNTLSVGCATPLPGGSFPLMYLYFKHPEFVENFYLYIHMQNFLQLSKETDADPKGVLNKTKRKLLTVITDSTMHLKMIKNVMSDLLFPSFYKCLSQDISHMKKFSGGIDYNNPESLKIAEKLYFESGKTLFNILKLFSKK